MKFFATAFVVSAIFINQSAFAGPPAEATMDEDSGTRTTSAHLLRQNNITSTGATVPHPGASQLDSVPRSSGMDRLNDKIDHSICKGC